MDNRLLESSPLTFFEVFHQSGAMIKLFKVKEKQRELAANASGKPPVKKQSAGELRLHKDVSELNLPKTCSISFPEGKDDLMNFEVTIQPDEGYYLGGAFVFSFQISPIYPHEAPKVKCKTKVYHPNIDLEGNVCLNILREDWKPVLNINTIIYGLYHLFTEPNHEDPLNPDAASVVNAAPTWDIFDEVSLRNSSVIVCFISVIYDHDKRTKKMSWEGRGGSTASSSAADGGGGGGRRKPSWRERENNRRRERRRRAIASKIYRGLRAQGNYNLPKHSDNNQVLKALCNEAGWIVEPDGTTYRNGFKPPPMEMGGTSTNITPISSRNPSPPSSYFASPIPSYQPNPSSSSFPSQSWLSANTSLPSFAFLHNSIPSSLPPLRISNSAPVTPPLSSPTRLPNQSFDFESLPKESMAALNIPFFATSAPVSPARWQRLHPATITECDKSNPSTTASRQWMNFRAYGNASDMVPPSPTFNLVRPVAPRVPSKDAMLEQETGMQFDFVNVAAKPWEGETIHEVGLDDLELTLGSGNTQI
ncbi:unnamed protein product [Fraxinus pennsylvanica]|uniref:Protein BZR1 homolog n=1 Tax=Fraxinus pennsylvanica TaxID=56036 RepID=A0AAD1ZKY5_9LAMI|nr:unnamed protein product [Fraxinus pennsylvanica]